MGNLASNCLPDAYSVGKHINNLPDVVWSRNVVYLLQNAACFICALLILLPLPCHDCYFNRVGSCGGNSRMIEFEI